MRLDRFWDGDIKHHAGRGPGADRVRQSVIALINNNTVLSSSLPHAWPHSSRRAVSLESDSSTLLPVAVPPCLEQFHGPEQCLQFRV